MIGCFLNILLKSKKGLSKPQFENQICRISDTLKSYYFSINVKRVKTEVEIPFLAEQPT